MNHEGHLFVGLLVGIITALALNVALSLQIVAIVFLASILPDIDLKQSKASKVVEFAVVVGGAFALQPFFPFSFPTSLLLAAIVSTVVLFVLLFPLRLKHRGVTHSFKAALFVGIVTAIALGITTGILAFAAYASHLIVDKV